VTKRFVSALLLTTLLFMQALVGLHRGSSGVGHGNNGWHDRLFATLEGRTGHPQTDASIHASTHASKDWPGGTRQDAQRGCDQLDHQLNPHAAHASTDAVCATELPALPPQATSPARISRFQKLGPPARGPPSTLS
jgi:hypothetical protein